MPVPPQYLDEAQARFRRSALAFYPESARPGSQQRLSRARRLRSTGKRIVGTQSGRMHKRESGAAEQRDRARTDTAREHELPPADRAIRVPRDRWEGSRPGLPRPGAYSRVLHFVPAAPRGPTAEGLRRRIVTLEAAVPALRLPFALVSFYRGFRGKKRQPATRPVSRPPRVTPQGRPDAAAPRLAPRSCRRPRRATSWGGAADRPGSLTPSQ